MSYSTEVLTDSPVAYWRLGESSGTTAVDEQGTHDGTVYGATLGATSLLASTSDTAYDFDGLDDYVEVPYSAALNPAVFSVEFWMTNRDWVTNVARPVANYENGLGWRFYTYDFDGSVWMTFKANDVALEYDLAPDTGAGTYHVVGTYDGTDMRLYWNGALVVGPTAGDYSPNLTVPLRIGRRSYDANGSWDGVIDEVAVYDTVLSPTRVQAHYDAGTRATPQLRARYDARDLVLSEGNSVSAWADSSGANHDLAQATAALQPVYRATGLNGKPAIEFTALSEQRLATAANFGLTNETPVTVLVMGTLGSAAQYRTILCQGGGTSGAAFVLAVYDYSDATDYPQRELTADQWGATGRKREGAIPLDTPVLMAFRAPSSWSSYKTDSELWLDGVRGTETNWGTAGTINLADNPLTVGGQPDQTGERWYWDGLISEVRVYDQTLTNTEFDAIQAEMLVDWEITTAVTLSLVSKTSTTVDLSWTEGGTWDEYQIERDGVVIDTIPGLTYTDTGLSPDTAYNYRVRGARAVV